ncbi:hypothetical protein SAE02_18970 [Skermanella aerolata]|uniref:HTH cro/C1-type domain-containing protein n=1 Tax=Skermanella aerolata TaxID=393310 RepID=A0A512DMQ5_9PROT|nr:helix-turn-helix transcriptional regulator [Skermanella aerolata]KJB96633.1 hypothetical protein N826_32765 [Skermanella aerolata KACC 11604]GEO37749.1 hypothetical protein SAE02_18970 [Skermanella aerolata]
MLDLLGIGERIAVERKALGLTQTQLAQRSRTSRATITALETGAQRELGFNKIMAILTVLGLDLRLTAANAGQQTLEDLQRERDR